MEIKSLDALENADVFLVDRPAKSMLFDEDSNGRKIFIYKLTNVKFCGESLFYPNVLAHSNGNLYNPIRETTMSLKNLDSSDVFDVNTAKNKYQYPEHVKIHSEPVFFFVYNMDNYYHFLYDTLPYLISYSYLKKRMCQPKLLVNYPNPQKKEFYKFNTEMLELLDIKHDDLIFVDDATNYENVYLSSSYTHDYDVRRRQHALSNNPPRKEVYDIYEIMRENALKRSPEIELHDDIYISRRTHLHNKFDNIGTNYTQRRTMVNEDELVGKLLDKGYAEVFTENMTTVQKIHLFYNCKNVVGSIGGGIANVVFSKPETKLHAIISPGFLDVNKRFRFCLDTVECTYVHDTRHHESGEFKKCMRVLHPSSGIVGEISDVNGNFIKVNYVDEKCAGWNSDMEYMERTFDKNKLERLDSGLNSSYVLDVDLFLI